MPPRKRARTQKNTQINADAVTHYEESQSDSEPENVRYCCIYGNELMFFQIMSQRFQHLIMNENHEHKPIWILPDNIILLEAFSPLYQQVINNCLSFYLC